MNKNTVKYVGKVSIAYKSGSLITKKKTHNVGLSDMALLFAKAVSGNLNQTTDIPRLLDIGYMVEDRTITKNDGITSQTGVWMSVLNKPVNIGGRQYMFDTSLNNWVSRLVSTIYFSDINNAVLEEVLPFTQLEENNPNKIQLKMRLCSYEPVDRKYLAEIDVSPDDITHIKDATSAIITWYSELLYNEENHSNNYTVSADLA